MTTSVSALVLSYNQEGLIAQAIMSLVEQTCQLDQIVISDDGSTDQTWNVIQETIEKIRNNHLYNGDIVLNRNNSNLGFIDNFNLGVSLCDSDLIMYNAGDDISMPFRNEMFLNEYKIRGNPKYFLGHSQVLIGDSNIRTPPIEMGNYSFERLSISCALHIGASQYFSKSLFDDFGEIKLKNTYEDLILGYRALLTESYCYVAQPLVKYDTSGLSGWTKNDYWRKRLRFKETLEQRIIDTVKFGRNDVIDHIVDCYQQYGYGVAKHPSSVSFVWLNFGFDSGIFSAYQSVNFDFVRPFMEITEVSDWKSIKDKDEKNFYIHYVDLIKNGIIFICELPKGATLVIDLGLLSVNSNDVSRLKNINPAIKLLFLSVERNSMSEFDNHDEVKFIENFYNIDGSIQCNYKSGLMVLNNSDKLNYDSVNSIISNNLDIDGDYEYFDIHNIYNRCIGKNLSEYSTILYIYDTKHGFELCEYYKKLSSAIGFNIIALDLSSKIIALNDFFQMTFDEGRRYLMKNYINSNKSVLDDRIKLERDRLYFESSIQKRISDYVKIMEDIFNVTIRMEKIFPL